MSDSKLVKVADSIETGDRITIGRSDVVFNVHVKPLKDETTIQIEAKKTNPEEGTQTSLLIILDPRTDKEITITKYELKEASPSSLDDYQVGEILEKNEYELEKLSIVN